MRRRIGPEPLLVRMRFALLMTVSSVVVATLLIAFYRLVGSGRANISIWCGMFGFGMVLGALERLRSGRRTEAAVLVAIAVVVIGSTLGAYQLIPSSQPIWITPN